MPTFTVQLHRIDNDGNRIPDYDNPDATAIDAKTSTIAIALAIQSAPEDALWDADAKRWEGPGDLGDVTPTLTELGDPTSTLTEYGEQQDPTTADSPE